MIDITKMCGAVRKAAGLTYFPHTSHDMAKSLTGTDEFSNWCLVCDGRMWGHPESWEHDVILEKECRGLLGIPRAQHEIDESFAGLFGHD